jgi:DNA-binding Lrp family transcriptional regulator
MDKLLKLLEEDARLTPAQIAVMTQRDEGDIKKAIEEYEKSGTILGYQALVDWDKTDREYVSAVIELRITPQRDRGFEKVAEMIYSYPEVKSLYLMSGGYDLHVIIECKTLREVASFVSDKLAVIDAVLSTSTHFVLKKYKDEGVIFGSGETDERGSCMV